MWDFLSGVGQVLGVGMAVICALLGILTIWWALVVWRKLVWPRWQRLAKLSTEWKTATGTLDNAGQTGGALNMYSYTFEVDGVIHRGSDDSSGRRTSDPGLTVEILYDPENPSFNNFLAHGAKFRAGFWMVGMAVLSLLLFGCGVLLLYMAADQVFF